MGIDDVRGLGCGVGGVKGGYHQHLGGVREGLDGWGGERLGRWVWWILLASGSDDGWSKDVRGFGVVGLGRISPASRGSREGLGGRIGMWVWWGLERISPESGRGVREGLGGSW